MTSKAIIVISDLHVGAGILDDCDGELEGCLIAFLTQLSQRLTPVELVINGDFLDFAQAPPWKGPDLESESPTGIPLSFTESQSCEKFKAISEAHTGIFKALETFLASKPDNALTILPGNHDADFFWDSVRAAFIAAISTEISISARIRFHLQEIYRPDAFPGAWIAHGHQYDPCNNFTINGQPFWSEQALPIFKDKTGQKRLYECVGTRFLIKFLNQLDAYYPFVDNVKPFSRFIRIFGASALVPGYGPIKALVCVYAMLKYLSVTVTHKPSDLMGLEQPGKGPDNILQLLLKGMSATETKAFIENVTKRGYQFDPGLPLDMYVKKALNAGKLMSFLTDNLDLLDDLKEKDPSLLSLSGNGGTLTLAKGFSVDETRELKNAASLILQSDDVKAVIMGHTHEGVDMTPSLNYINTGSWTRYYQFTTETNLRSWSMLRGKTFDHFPFQLNYAEIVPDSATPVRKVTFKL